MSKTEEGGNQESVSLPTVFRKGGGGGKQNSFWAICLGFCRYSIFMITNSKEFKYDFCVLC